jgi:DNA modification methylase
MGVTLLQGDVIEQLRPEADESYTACFCDPPYGLKFMGRNWDHGVPGVNYWAEVKRVLKPGGVLMAFGGTRTWHRLACAIEDAGFEVFDTLMWLYGSGFPKSHDISKAIDKEAGAEREVIGENQNYCAVSGKAGYLGQATFRQTDGMEHITAPATPDAATWSGYGTSLKPAWEPVICARKPRAGTYAQTAIEHGAGALWIDGGRIGTEQTITRRNGDSGGNGAYGRDERVFERVNPPGRWPANLLLDEVSAEMLGEQSGESKSTAQPRHNGSFDSIAKGHEYPHVTYGHNDAGTAARFFYCAKASRAERDAGLEGFERKATKWQRAEAGVLAQGKNPITGERTGNLITPPRNHHPTVKPIDLCRYLCTLIRPPESYLDEARLLVPFAGSGSECIGAMLAGWRNITCIEKETEYVEIARARIAHWGKRLKPYQLSNGYRGYVDPLG